MKILLATGGTGGHIFPALHVANILKEKGHEILFIGVLNKVEDKIRQKGFKIAHLSAKGLTFNSLMSVLASSYCMSKAFIESIRLIKKFKPEVVCGFGGYASFSVVLAAKFLGYPVMIHEQNVIPGRANAILAKLVDQIAISFKKSEQFFKSPKAVLTGCPCYGRLPTLTKGEALARFQLQPNKVTILILGGSQGSHRINVEFVKTAQLLKEMIDFQIIHLTGQQDYGYLDQQYKTLNVVYRLFSFLDDMISVYSAADVVVARAGAVTISEIVAFGLPSVLIPYPFAGGHQKENAHVLCDVNMATVIDDQELTSEKLKKAILAWVNKKMEPNEVRNRLQEIYCPDAAQNVAAEIICLAKG